MTGHIKEHYEEFVGEIVGEIVNEEMLGNSGEKKRERVVNKVRDKATENTGVLHVLQKLGARVFPTATEIIVYIIVSVLNRYIGRDWIKAFKTGEKTDK